MKYFIITGTSRGLGEAIAKRLAAPGHRLFCISRKRNERLLSGSGLIDYFEFDLNETDRLEELMQLVFDRIDPADAEALYLVNNAAVVAPLSRIEEAGEAELTANLHINLLAPMLLTSLFIRYSRHFRIEKRVLNVSSVSARNLLPGMSAYSAAKAGLDVFSKCVGIEQGEAPYAVKIASVWPGMIDTGLQEEARSADAGAFPSAGLFAMVKDRGLLATPEAVAEKIAGLLLGDRFEQGAVVEEL
ncbi:SDR family NAD(P)-dependent oxidoreductase [Paenibacillus hamazuiensis]|uniref:SDR family NAD(P)-dependent oxidoreductase n=1 Tax=Paenibacillus hamazuiensis TaxID=2936508 RepID=UPI00200F7AE5|nr:SDR family NAD(P)-dependent oxidoreductase [Paenibacillus hamazuiensis]